MLYYSYILSIVSNYLLLYLFTYFTNHLCSNTCICVIGGTVFNAGVRAVVGLLIYFKNSILEIIKKTAGPGVDPEPPPVVDVSLGKHLFIITATFE